MPLYDLKCKECGKEFEHFCKINEVDLAICECGSLCKVLITNTKSRDWFRPHWRENIDFTPEYIETKGQLKEHCLRNGVTAHCLGDVRNIKEI